VTRRGSGWFQLLRATIDMSRYRFGEREYRYFEPPCPEPIEALKQARCTRDCCRSARLVDQARPGDAVPDTLDGQHVPAERGLPRRMTVGYCGLGSKRLLRDLVI
jgi:hypothetical protein